MALTVSNDKSFYYVGTNGQSRKINVPNESVFIQNSLSKDDYWKINVDRQDATAEATSKDFPQKEYRMTNSAGRGILDYILGLDKNKDDFTTKDFDAINEADLRKQFPVSNVRVKEKNDTTKRAVIQYEYTGSDGGKQTAELTIDFETDDERQAREDQERTKSEMEAELKNLRAEQKAQVEREQKERLDAMGESNKFWGGKHKIFRFGL